ncbi:MAG: PEGA domain-containing protein [Planctomycetes bacterium]|nr:PEGA domain-containing protein [Planctomycetota bacterium]
MRTTLAEGWRALLLAALAAGLVGLAGCATDRRLIVTSTPPGALVRLDDTVVGSTPYEIPFDAYGVRRVTLYKQGFATASQQVVLDAPWYLAFPFDIVSEVLLPFGWKDVHRVDITLQQDTGPVTRPDLAAVLRRAESLRLAEPSGPRPSTIPPPPKPTRPSED